MSLNSAYAEDFVYEKCVKDVQTFFTSSTINKMHLYIANSKKLTVYSFNSEKRYGHVILYYQKHVKC